MLLIILSLVLLLAFIVGEVYLRNKRLDNKFLIDSNTSWENITKYCDRCTQGSRDNARDLDFHKENLSYCWSAFPKQKNLLRKNRKIARDYGLISFHQARINFLKKQLK